MYRVAIPECECPGDFLVSQAYPACVEPEGLSQKDNLLSIVSNLLFRHGAFRPGHYQIVFNSGETAVFPYSRSEGFRFLEYQLDVQTGIMVYIVY
jgi:hypothetical protein